MEHDWEDYHPPIEELISLRQAAEFSDLSQTHLRLLVRNKAIWGIKIDTMWLTTKIAVLKYIKIERKTGPKPKSP